MPRGLLGEMAQAQQRTVYRTMRRIAGVTLRCVRGTGQGVAHTYSNSAMTGRVARPSVSNSHFKQRPSVRLLAAHLARVLPFASRLRKDEGASLPGESTKDTLKPSRREGRAPAGTRRSVRHGNAHGVDHRCCRIARPSLRDGFNVSFVLSPGSDALLPPSPCRSLMRVSGWTKRITTGLDAQAPGVRTTRLVRPRTSSLELRALACAHARNHAKTLSASCRTRDDDCSRPSRPATPTAPDAVASIAPQPAVRDDRDPPLVLGQGVSLVR
jgi:hypothetical protein